MTTNPYILLPNKYMTNSRILGSFYPPVEYPSSFLRLLALLSVIAHSSFGTCSHFFRRPRQVDIWGIGVCLYVMLTKRLPFPCDSLTQLHALMLDGALYLPDGFSAPLKDILKQLLQVGSYACTITHPHRR